MGDGAKSRRERFEAEARDPHTRAKLTYLANSLMREPAAAKDLVQSAVLAAYDPSASPWDPDGGVPFFRHVGNLMIGMASNDRRSFFARRVELDGEMTIDDQVAGDARPADEELDGARFLAHLKEVQTTLLAAVERDDPRAADVYRAMREGIEGTAAIAAHVGCSPEDVVRAYQRLTYQGRRIVEQEEQRVLEAMKQRRRSHPARTVTGVSE